MDVSASPLSPNLGPDSGKASLNASTTLNLDAPIYRIFSLWDFEDVLRHRRLRLVQPRAWDDPFERLLSGVHVTGLGGGYKPIEPKSKVLYAQCWSSAQESDTLWRAYSRVTKHPRHQRNIHPGEEGVQVTSTPRKLLDALANSFNDGHDAFVGQVNYMTEEQISSIVGGRLRAGGPDAYEHANALANFYSMKREAFRSEAEVRLMLVAHSENEAPLSVEFPIDPNALFDEARFDPRLVASERAEREAELRRRGFTNPCPQSGLYVPMLLEVPLDAKDD